MIRRALASALVAASLASVACGPDRPPPAAAPRESGPQWQDVFDGTPDIYAVLRPQAIKRDPVYGSLWKSVVRLASARSWVGGATTLDAAEGAEEIILGINRGEDAALVIRGVPANLDPAKVTDTQGHPLFRVVDDRAKVVELEPLDRKNANPGAVFVLDSRTWVGAIGEARVRARQAFASPMNRPTPKVDAAALAVVRFGTPVVANPTFVKHPLFGPLTKKIASVTVLLLPDKGGVIASLAYEDQDAAAWAELQTKRLADELAKDERRFGWLKDAKIAYEGNAVVVKVAVPTRLLEELPNATGADVPL